ncbi:MAG TPA: hypothetical protein VJA94_07705, partial [Candidatus Angelobacter sp.]
MMIEKANEILKAISNNKELSQQLRTGDYGALQELALNFEEIYGSTDSGTALGVDSGGTCNITIQDFDCQPCNVTCNV